MNEPVPARASRFPFRVEVDLIDMQSNTQTHGQTIDLSLFGIHVDAVILLKQGARVKVRIADKGLEFVAFGRVAYSRADLGMGIVFSDIKTEAQRILDGWLVELSGQPDSRTRSAAVNSRDTPNQ